MEIVYREHLISIKLEEFDDKIYGCYIIRYAHKVIRAARIIPNTEPDDESAAFYETFVVAQSFVDKAVSGENIA